MADSSLLSAGSKKGKQASLWLLRQAASARWRWFLIVLGLIMAAWLGWQSGWLPLQQEAPLPAGVTPRNPELDVELLETINDQRLDRVQHRLRAAVGLDRIFAQPSPSLAPTLPP